MTDFFTADLHFGHNNVINFKNTDGTKARDFATVQDMEDAMVQMHNEIVKPTDKVYMLGDIAFNLLIFFVILARAQDDSFLNWQPAEASDLENTGPAKVSVLIDSEDLESQRFFLVEGLITNRCQNRRY